MELAKSLRCVVFDFDGVLVQSNEVKRSAYFEIFAPFDVAGTIVERALRESPYGDRYMVIERVLRQLDGVRCVPLSMSIDEAVRLFAERYNRICEEHAATCSEVLGVSDALPRLACRYALYVNSDTPEEPLRRVIERRRWRVYFRDVLGRPRTKAENLELILNREGVAPTAVVVVGDTGRDLIAAKQYGCLFVGIRSDENDFEDTDFLVFEDISQLDDAIRRGLDEGWGTC